ncbi:MAG TPA: mechanosensitive ion channel family protein [bacterium]|nr:mechanosensitive ion channel family protein [bacterium]
MDWLDLEQLRALLAHGSHWIIQTFLAVLGALLVDLALRRMLTRLQGRLEVRTRTPWDEAVIDALRPPLSVMIWLVGIAFAASIVGRATHAPIFDAVGPLRTMGVIIVITWFMIRLVRHGQKVILAMERPDGTHPDFTTVDSIAKLLRVAILITGALVALQTLGFSISGVLAFGGIGGIAVGFAARDVLANFFGGLMVYLDRPFAVGEWIRSPDRDIEGTVEEISWRLTRIRTFDQRPLYVPNATFSTIAVENPSRMFNRRIKETVGIRYDDAAEMAGIVEEVKQMLLVHPDIDTSRTLMVNFDAFGPSSLDFFLYCFTKTTVWAEYHAVKQDVLFKVMEIIDQHGAQIAFPTSTLHVPDGVTVRSEAEAARKAAQAEDAAASAPNRADATSGDSD